MRFTSVDLMKAMGLSVGDRIKVEGYSQIFEITKSHEDIIRLVANDTSLVHINWLIDKNFEIMPRQKRNGNLKCGLVGEQEHCDTCPVRILCEHHSCNEFGAGDTLYDYLNAYYDYYILNEGFKGFDQEIYDLIKVRLDKEVE